MSYQKCPVCDGLGYTQKSLGSCPTCTVCDGKKIISTLTGRPPKFPENTLESNGRTYNIVDPAKIAEANKEIAEQMKIHRKEYLQAVQKQNQELSDYRRSVDKKFRGMHDIPADVEKIINDNFTSLISEDKYLLEKYGWEYVSSENGVHTYRIISIKNSGSRVTDTIYQLKVEDGRCNLFNKRNSKFVPIYYFVLNEEDLKSVTEHVLSGEYK